MTMMDKSANTIAPLLLRNLLTSLFTYADKPLLFLAEKSKILELLRHILVSVFLFFLRLLPCLFPCLIPSSDEDNRHHHKYDYNQYPLRKPSKGRENHHHHRSSPATLGGGDAGIARAISQLLTLVTDIPVSSRKYEVVRSLAEKLLDENLSEGNEALREINCKVLSAAFSRTLGRLETAVLEQAGGNGDVMVGSLSDGDWFYRLSRLLRGVKYYGQVMWQRAKLREDQLSCKGSSAEKLAAELLWLAQRMAACGCADEAVCKWALSTNLAWLALSAEPRLQGSLVKVSVFLFKKAKDMTISAEDEKGTNSDQIRRTKLMMLKAWLPLLCRGSNGTDAPVLSISERAELEKVLEEIIEKLEQGEEQEQVLSLWLHHFTCCASSDWPNLQNCYTKWCNTSRRSLLLLH